MFPVGIQKELQFHIDWVIDAHANFAKKKNPIRFWDKSTPYYVHPLWCGVTILTETELDERLRWEGALTLLYHDVLEDTTKGLPKGLSQRVQNFIGEMTFYGGIEEEMENVWGKSDETILFKLYDKTSNLLDAVWMSPESIKEYKAYTRKLLGRVRDLYGDLHITRITKQTILIR